LFEKTKFAFQSSKVFFIIIPFFTHVDPSKPFILETFTPSNFALGTIFSQLKENNLLHFIDVHFCKFFHVKINYEIYDKEFVAIMHAFEEWFSFTRRSST
jgi:hypothetical protein